MMTAPETRPSLLLRIRNPHDQRAWTEFYEIYHPLIVRLALQRGLQDCDAREIAQDVLVSVSKAIGRWECDPARGSFRGWLSRITRNLVINLQIRQTRHPRGSGNSDLARLLDEVPAPDSEESRIFDLEYRRQLFLWAASEIRCEFRETAWEAFWRTSIEEQDVKEVSQSLGISSGALYVARSRIMKRLRERIEQRESDREDHT